MPRAEPEGEPERTQSTPEPRAEPKNNYAPNAEPVPEWPAAKEEWHGAWELHYIGFGILFLLIVIWSILALLRARKTPLLVTRRFCFAVNFLLIVFGTTRALSLFLYPYEMVDYAGGTPVVIQRLLFGLGFPCLTAGFTLIHFAFLEAAKVSYGSRRIQNLKFIIGVIALHFSLVLVAEIVTSYVPNTSVLVIVCMMYFIICALLVSASVLYSGTNVVRQSKTHRRTMKRISIRANSTNSTVHDKRSTSNAAKYANKESNTDKVARVTMVTAGLGIVCAALQIYAMVGVFKVRNGSGSLSAPKPWAWWIYQTVFRLIELGLAGTMAYTVSQPKKGHGLNLHHLVCCGLKTRKRAETFTDSGLTSSENYNVQPQSYV